MHFGEDGRGSRILQTEAEKKVEFAARHFELANTPSRAALFFALGWEKDVCVHFDALYLDGDSGRVAQVRTFIASRRLSGLVPGQAAATTLVDHLLNVQGPREALGASAEERSRRAVELSASVQRATPHAVRLVVGGVEVDALVYGHDDYEAAHVIVDDADQVVVIRRRDDSQYGGLVGVERT